MEVQTGFWLLRRCSEDTAHGSFDTRKFRWVTTEDVVDWDDHEEEEEEEEDDAAANDVEPWRWPFHQPAP